MMTEVVFTLNGERTTLRAPTHWTLLKCLRDVLGLTGAKQGCESGHCGACIVLAGNRPVNSCLVLAAELGGQEIWTIEGLKDKEAMIMLQDCYVRHAAFQCGICTPGMLMTSYGLLLENPRPKEEDVRAALAGNLCRCTGYQRAIEAVVESGERMSD
jgi:carbon-monoxide dehydrogenase small subunit